MYAMSSLEDEIKKLLRAKVVRADQVEAILKKTGWQRREPPKNQPHYYKDKVFEYVVVDKRYGNKTIQNQTLAKKYLKRILENL